MRAHQVFASMSPERAAALLEALSRQTPAVFAEALAVAGGMLKARPVYLRRLPFERRAEAVRKALSRVVADQLAEEVLATYFLECRQPLLEEWLDALGLAHEQGVLEAAAPPQPEKAALEATVKRFRAGGEDAPDRELLLRAFAAQHAIDWPDLDALLSA